MSELDLSKVSREALEALAHTLVSGVSQFSDYEEQLERVRAEATAEPDAPRTPVLRPEFVALGEALGMSRPKTTASLCYEGDCAKMTGRARPCPFHDEPKKCPHCERDPRRCGCSLLDDAQQPPLRTRAEVDAEIAGLVRGANRLGNGNEIRSQLYGEKLARLCDEPTLPRAELTGEERAVLAAVADADIETVGGRHRQRRQFMCERQEDAVCRAELARRAARKESKP